jgi:hypothetical protein
MQHNSGEAGRGSALGGNQFEAGVQGFEVGGEAKHTAEGEAEEDRGADAGCAGRVEGSKPGIAKGRGGEVEVGRGEGVVGEGDMGSSGC